VLALLILQFYRTSGESKNTCISHDSQELSRKIDTEAALPKANDGRRIRWAIVALAKPGKSDLDTRNQAIAQRIKPYAKHHDITVIVFSEQQFPRHALESWRSTYEGVAKVEFINTARNGFNLPERFGYKYMCKFFSLDIYDHLKDRFDYYMRVDSDCYFKTMKYDIFRWAEESKVGYAFAMRKIEAHGPTKQTIPVWVSKYTQRCSIVASAPMDQPLSTCFNFYNNFHIGRVDFFNRPDVRHFLEAVNTSGHILSHRWGDSTIQAYAVRLFMRPEAIVQVPNFTYVHGSHGKQVSSFGDGSGTNVPQRLPNWKHSS
jgi:hypothetical protein